MTHFMGFGPPTKHLRDLFVGKWAVHIRPDQGRSWELGTTVQLIGDLEGDPCLCYISIQEVSSKFFEWPGVLSDWLAIAKDQGLKFLDLKLEVWQPQKRV